MDHKAVRLTRCVLTDGSPLEQTQESLNTVPLEDYTFYLVDVQLGYAQDYWR